MIKHIVIYHANCADGFGAAWAASKAPLPEGTEYVAANYGEALPGVAGKFVHILDFSYSLDVMKSIWQQCRALVWLDHHKTARETAQQFLAWLDTVNTGDSYRPVHVEFDDNRSGAGLAWDYYCASSQRPLLIDLIEDRDLWRFSFGMTKPFALALRSEEMTFASWDYIHQHTQDFIARGLAMQNYYDRQLHEALIATMHRVRLIGTNEEGLAANLPPMFASDAGNIMAKDSGTFGLSYYLTGSGQYACSLRSIGDYDVSEIAKRFGGGGHKNAAGFSCGTPVWVRL